MIPAPHRLLRLLGRQDLQKAAEALNRRDLLPGVRGRVVALHVPRRGLHELAAGHVDLAYV